MLGLVLLTSDRCCSLPTSAAVMLLSPHLQCAQPSLETVALQHLSLLIPQAAGPCCVLSTPALIPRSLSRLPNPRYWVAAGATWHNQGWAAASLCSPGPTEHLERVSTTTVFAQSPLPSFMPPPCHGCAPSHTPCRLTQGLDQAQLLAFQLFIFILKCKSSDTSPTCEQGSSVVQEQLASLQHCCPCQHTCSARLSCAQTLRAPAQR